MSGIDIIKVVRGDIFELRCKLADSDGKVMPLAEGYGIRMQVRKSVDGGLVHDFATDGNIEILTVLDDDRNKNRQRCRNST